MHWWDGGWHMGWMALWWAVGLALFAAVVWLLVRATRPPVSGQEPPEEILKRRYARGELDEETFRRMRRELQGPREVHP